MQKKRYPLGGQAEQVYDKKQTNLRDFVKARSDFIRNWTTQSNLHHFVRPKEKSGRKENK